MVGKVYVSEQNLAVFLVCNSTSHNFLTSQFQNCLKRRRSCNSEDNRAMKDSQSRTVAKCVKFLSTLCSSEDSQDSKECQNGVSVEFPSGHQIKRKTL